MWRLVDWSGIIVKIIRLTGSLTYYINVFVSDQTISEQTCLRCEHRWFPRSLKLSIVCPKCMSPYWNIPRKSEQADVSNDLH